MRVKLIRDRAGLDRLVQDLQQSTAVGFDTEGSGPKLYGQDMINVWRSTITGASFAVSDSLAYYLPLDHTDHALPLSYLAEALDSIPTEVPVWAHNWKHDLSALQNQHLPVPCHIADSMVAAWLSGDSRLDSKLTGFGLKALMKIVLKIDPETFAEVMADKQANEVPATQIKKYAGLDAIASRRLGLYYLTRIREQNLEKWFWDVEMMIVRILQDMHRTGIRIAPKKLEKVAVECEEKLEDVTRRWNAIAPRKRLNEKDQAYYVAHIRKVEQGCKVGKPQLRKIARLDREQQQAMPIGSATALRGLYDLGIWNPAEVMPTKAGEPKTDAEAVQWQLENLPEDSLGHKLAALKKEYQDYAKILSTYTRTIIAQAAQHKDGRLRGSFHQTGPATGRLSSSQPNLQNFPARGDLAKKVLEAFRPSVGNVVISGDYSQVELRILAHVTGDENLIAAFNSGEDIHTASANNAGVPRHVAKTMNFLIVYGGGAQTLSRKIKCSQDEAAGFIERYHMGYPKVQVFMDRMSKYAEDKGYTLSLAHRRRYLSKSLSKPRRARIAGNNPIQGGASDIMKKAMVDLWNRLGQAGLQDEVKFLSQIHDDLILDVPVAHIMTVRTMMKECMEGAWKLKVPLTVEPKVGHSFAELKD